MGVRIADPERMTFNFTTRPCRCISLSHSLSLCLPMSPHHPSLDSRAGTASTTLFDSWKSFQGPLLSRVDCVQYNFKMLSMSFSSPRNNTTSDIFQYMRTRQCE